MENGAPRKHRQGGRRRLAVIAGVVVAAGAVAIGVVVFGDGGDDNVASSAAEEPDRRPIVVTRESGNGPRLCRPRDVARRLDDFSRALRTVDADALSRFMEGLEAIEFTRYGESEFFAGNYDDALKKLRRMGGLQIHFDTIAIQNDGGTFQGRFHTQGGRVARFWGKGGWSCQGPGIKRIVMVVSRKPNRFAGRCPKPRKRPKGAMVACTQPR